MRISFLLLSSLIGWMSFPSVALAQPRSRRPRIACVQVGDRLQCFRKPPVQTLRLCPSNPRLLCVSPKKGKSQSQLQKPIDFQVNSNTLTWSPIDQATHYQVKLQGHNRQWQRSTIQPQLNVGELMQPGNAYRIHVTAYQGNTVINQLHQVINFTAE